MTKKERKNGPPSSARFGDLLSIWGPVLLLTAVGFVVAFQFIEPAPPRHLVMATGATDGAYYRFGLKYREVLERHGVELELRTTAGSVENLELLRDPESGVDVALIQGGVGSKDSPAGLNGLASLFYEPIWFFQFLIDPGEYFFGAETLGCHGAKHLGNRHCPEGGEQTMPGKISSQKEQIA